MTSEDTAPPPAPEGGELIADHLELLAEMGRDFAASLDIDDTVRRALARITRYVDAEGGAVFLLDDDGTQLRCTACVGATDITGLVLGADQGIVGRSVQNNTGEIVRDVSKDPAFYSKVDKQTGFTTRSILCAPMSVQDQRLGAIELVNKRDPGALFDETDLRVLEVLSTSAALALLNARMAEALVEQERVRREIELAAEIQRSLLPAPRPLPFPVHGLNVPARLVSGDFYDFFPLSDGRIAFNLGDVSGKGMNAALLMAKTASLYRCLGKSVGEPGRLLAIINDEICETATRGMFVTMVGGVYDPATGTVRLANAGHEPPLVHAAAGGFTALAAEAPPLGIVPAAGGEGLPETELRLDGGTLYVFTDGVTEGLRADGDRLAVDGFKDHIRAHAGQPTDERLQGVVAPLNPGAGTLHDDITVLAVDDSGPAKERAPAAPAAAAEERSERLLDIRVPARADRLKMIRAAVSQAALQCGCSDAVARDLVIAVDEACQNVIRHAYGGESDSEMVLEIRRAEGKIELLLRDFAETIDTAAVRPRDLGDLRPGGLGTHFIREVMDEVDFLPPPAEGGNLLKMAKRIG